MAGVLTEVSELIEGAPATREAIFYRINEERFIAEYVKLTGANEGLARNVYIFLEPAHFRAFP